MALKSHKHSPASGFQKGHPFFPSASEDKLHRRGRKRKPARLLKDAEQLLGAEYLPKLIIIYAELAMDGKHPDLFQYLYDRVVGKPRAMTEISLEAKVGADQYYALIEKMKAEERLLSEAIDKEPKPGGDYKQLPPATVNSIKQV